MKVYKIYNKKYNTYATSKGWGRGIKANYDDIASATRAVAHCRFSKEDVEIHGFELSHVTTRTNQNGGKWNAEISINSED